jgi:hypothetical protein
MSINLLAVTTCAAFITTRKSLGAAKSGLDPLAPMGAKQTLCSISAALRPMHDEPVNEINPDFDALLVFLANWEAIERSALGRILTAGQLADVQELERLYALPSEPEGQPASDI